MRGGLATTMYSNSTARDEPVSDIRQFTSNTLIPKNGKCGEIRENNSARHDAGRATSPRHETESAKHHDDIYAQPAPMQQLIELQFWGERARVMARRLQSYPETRTTMRDSPVSFFREKQEKNISLTVRPRVAYRRCRG